MFYKRIFLLTCIVGGVAAVCVCSQAAQNFQVLHHFNSESNGAAHPFAGVILSGTNFYGTTTHGGLAGAGTVFRVSTNGMHFANLHSFTVASGPDGTNSDGVNPRAGLIISGDTLYGTASQGGQNGDGTVFALNTDGTDFRVLYTFNDDAIVQISGLILSGNTLYGTTDGGGIFGPGTVFALQTDGTGFTNIYNFSDLKPGPPFNSDGTYPLTEMVLAGTTLYGTTGGGGQFGQGIVFSVNTDGTKFTNLHSFTYTNGGIPNGGLVLSGEKLYGTAIQGGSFGVGTLFAINTDGAGFNTLHNFNGTNGAYPGATLFLSGKSLFGTTAYGGISGSGTVFKINTDGTGFSTLHQFTATSGSATNLDGATPYSSLVLSDNLLYGTTRYGGTSGQGTLFSIYVFPEIAITSVGNNAVVSWPTNAMGFTLQTATNLSPPVIWSTVSTNPIVVNGENTMTQPITGARQFFRLSQ
jgi:uncharacterized repeat protein (TIGR03803 family)